MRVPVRSILMAMFLIAAAGCMSWTPGWQSPPVVAPTSDAASLQQAESLLEEADTAAALRDAIVAFEAVPMTGDGERIVHTRLAEAHVLFGAAYARSRAEKRHHYESGLRHAERAMATNREFRDRMLAGASIGDASRELERPEAEAMLLWVTGVSYYFREVLATPGRILSVRKIAQTEPMLNRLMEIDPTLENGAVPFSLAIHYIARPPWAGQDLGRALELFDQAVEISPRSLLIRWGRAKYLHEKNGDSAAFRQDLEWVIAQDPLEAATPYHWNVYLQRDARRMLSDATH